MKEIMLKKGNFEASEEKLPSQKRATQNKN